MSLDTLFIHTCNISRFTEGAVDDYGVPVKTWAVLYASEPCRITSDKGREIRRGAEVVVSNWKLFVDTSVVVTEQDRISNILLRADGTVIDASTYEILLVQPKSDGTDLHHNEIYLQKVT